MATKIETLRAPRQVSPWLVIGVAATLIAALAVLTVPETAVTPTREPVVTTVRVTDDVAEMAAVKSAVAHRYMAERFGISESAPSVNENVLDAAVKARLVHGYLGPSKQSQGSGSEKGHPVRRTG